MYEFLCLLATIQNGSFLETVETASAQGAGMPLKNLEIARGVDVQKSLQGAGEHQGVLQSTGLLEGSAEEDFCAS